MEIQRALPLKWQVLVGSEGQSERGLRGGCRAQGQEVGVGVDWWPPGCLGQEEDTQAGPRRKNLGKGIQGAGASGAVLPLLVLSTSVCVCLASAVLGLTAARPSWAA